MDKILFYRHIENVDKYNEYLSKLDSKYLLLENWTKQTLYEIFLDNYQEQFLLFKFYLLNVWITKYNQSLDINQFYKQLKYYLDLLKLHSYLNADENNYLYQLEQTVFLMNKPIKSLIVDFALNNNEIAYFHFDNCALVNNKNVKFIFNEFYLTNQRIVFLNDNYISWINLDKAIINYQPYSHLYFFYYENCYLLEYENLLNIEYALKYLNYLEKN